jgi:hypothetical protein
MTIAIQGSGFDNSSDSGATVQGTLSVVTS